MKLNRFHKQSGASLMEVLVAMSISLVVTASMIAMMSNSLGTTARIIKMTKLQDDMRVAMQMMSRDVRRSSYNALSQYCYANHNCDDDADINIDIAGAIVISDDNSCFTFLTDRNHDGNALVDLAGGFRRVTDDDGVGLIEMWTGNHEPDCEAAVNENDDWVQVTNPDHMDIYDFRVDDELSYTDEILNNGVDIVNKRIRKVRMDMKGQLVLDNDIRREVIDIIDVRNDVIL